jgi:phospholipase C
MPINYIVLLMMENRSYDNVLGALYLNGPSGPTGQQDLDGLTGTETNPGPTGPVSVWNAAAPVQLGGTGPSYASTCLPIIDTGEMFCCMAQQFLNLHGPTGIPMPYQGYSPGASGLMQGFVRNYSELDKAVGQTAPPPQNLRDVMSYMTPEQLPVTAFLARNYAVCDQWFASVPTQTFTNRAFAVLAAPAVEKPDRGESWSYIDDEQYLPRVFAGRVELTSIFKKLDEVYPGPTLPNWKVYFHDYPINLFTDKYVFDTAGSTGNINVAPFDDTDYGSCKPIFLGRVPSSFVTDVSGPTGPPPSLPKFSFIEPRYSNITGLPPNSFHPGGGNILPGIASPGNIPMDAASGDLLLMQVYNALRNNPTVWNETLLIVTFDEHGGLYDHVPPPGATAPGQGIPPAQSSKDPAANGFDFTVLGGRVPAILISPFIDPGSTIRAATPFDHTSIIKTVWDNFTLGSGSLTDRDAAAPSLVPLSGSNSTGAFSGTIVCSPSSVLFSQSVLSPLDHSQTLYASAGNIPLAARLQPMTPAWLTITSNYASATGILTVSLETHRSKAGIHKGLQTAQIVISGTGVTSVTVTVTLDLT